ncbi:GNAT family N-acetyltransferase [Nonomuraea indica]|uniref:GNAT family N-acetyltransferase n=1 Tax=Nonomuraea indica TaxID=1581193 RepID=A0ABW8A7P6_9ACTN|nr:GNAT family N-acetyltransferase [Nonomuraea indica]
MHTITRLTAGDFHDAVEALAGLLTDVVADGASLGFVLPFGRDEAAAWWRAQEPAVADGSLRLWVARTGGGIGGIAGVVGLALERKPNGSHRAEIVKLMVHPGARGHGLGRTLLGTAERAAVAAGVTLLLLDTETGSAADRLYPAAGWARYGVVPGYAADPAGTPRDCSFYYKRLERASLA